MVELVLGVHFIVVLYLVLGFPIALYYNHRLFRIVHTSWLAAVSLLMVLGIPLPSNYSGRNFKTKPGL